MNLNLGAVFGKLLSEPENIDLHRIGGDVAGQSEDMIFNILFRHHAALPAQQDFQHGGFTRGKHTWFAVDEDLMAFGIVGEIGEAKRTAEQLAGTAQDRFQARHQFFQCKRLDQIVVGTAAQATDAVIHTVARGQHQHRQRILAMPDVAQNRQAVAVRQAKIEDQGGIIDRRQGALRLAGIIDDIRRISRGQKSLGHEFSKLDIVLYNQKSHVIPSLETRRTIGLFETVLAGMADLHAVSAYVLNLNGLLPADATPEGARKTGAPPEA